MSEENQNPVQGNNEIPPKQAPFKAPGVTPLKPPNASASEPGAPTVLRRPVLRRPGEDAAAAGGGAEAGKISLGIQLPAGATIKRDTSRIDLPAGELRPAVGAEIKTVKVKPVQAPVPGSDPLPAGPKPLSETQLHAAKSKTSRISLDAALSGEAASSLPPAATPPKTIRLKRPTDIAGGSPQIPAPSMTNVMPGSTSSMTARLPTSHIATQHIQAEEPAEPTTMTRRKTIKVKRPASAGVRIQRPSAQAAAQEPSEELKLQSLGHVSAGVAAAGPDTAHWFFITAAILVVVASIGLSWILASQTFGPNAAVTGYVMAYGPDLPSPIPGTVLTN